MITAKVRNMEEAGATCGSNMFSEIEIAIKLQKLKSLSNNKKIICEDKILAEM